MDYDKLIANLKKPLFAEGSYIVDHSRREAAKAITDLLVENQALRNAANGFKERAEKAELERDEAVHDRMMMEQMTAELLARAEAAEKQRDEARQDCAVAERNHMIEVERRKAAEARAEKAKEIAIELCDDFTDFVTGGVHNAAPYCANFQPECVDGRGWCNGDNRVCKGFLPKAAGVKEE